MASGAVPAASDFPKCAMGGTRSEFVRGIEPLENRVVPGSRPSVIALEITESYTCRPHPGKCWLGDPRWVGGCFLLSRPDPVWALLV